ncbi:DMT family transporter [Paracoccaceae bacterium]|nr:DMT family transporter [Paracoccaceae bacterium]
MTDARPPWTEFALLGLLALLWGSSYGFIKLAVTEIPPMTLIAARGTIAAAMLIALVMIRGDKWPTDARTWGMLLVQAFFNGIGAWTLLAWGQQHIDSGLASVLNSTSPIFVVLITLLILRNGTIGPRATFGAFLGLGGVILMIGVGVLDGLGKEIAGQAAALAGAALYACAALYGRRFTGLPAPVIAATTMLWTAIWLVPAAFIFEDPLDLTPSATAIGAAVALGVFCTGFAVLIYFRLIKTLGPAGVASQAYLRAGLGVLIGVVLFQEVFTLSIAAGLLAAILGVALINTDKRKAR